MAFSDRVSQFVTDHPKTCLTFSLVVALCFGLFSPLVPVESNVDYLTIEDHPDTRYYEEFKQQFGNDEFFVIALEADNLFTEQKLRTIKDVTERLENLEGVRQVISLANAMDAAGSDDVVTIAPFLEHIPRDEPSLQRLKRQIQTHPVYAKQLISSDGRVAAIMVFPEIKENDPAFRLRLIDATKDVLQSFGFSAGSYHMVGWTVVNVALSTYMNRDLRIFIPISYLVISLMLYFCFSSLRITLIGIVNILLCLASTLGFFVIYNMRLNNVTAIVPPLIMALSLSDTIHFFSAVLGRSDPSGSFRNNRHMRTALTDIFIPCFLTTLTTFAGFLSLATSKMPPIRDFAWAACTGIAFEFFYFLFFVPSALLLLGPQVVQLGRVGVWFDNLLEWASHFLMKYKKRLTWVCLSVIGVGIFLSLQIRVNTNIVSNFLPSDPVRRSLNFVEAKLCGVGTLDLVVTSDKPGTLIDVQNLEYMDSLSMKLRRMDSIDKVVSIVDLLKDTHKAMNSEDMAFYTLPPSRELAAQYLLLFDPEDLDDFLNDSRDKARISIFLNEHDSSSQKKLIQDIRAIAASTIPEGLKVRLTGRVLQEVNNIDELVNGQIQSLALAFLMIWMILLMTYRSLFYLWVSALANLFPVAINFALMRLLGIPLNTGTALIVVVGIGIAVDGTIHMLSHYRMKISEGVTRQDSIISAVTHKSYALALSAFILMIGFGVLLTSRFVPTIQFGALSAAIMFTALIGDVVFLPSLILSLSGSRRNIVEARAGVGLGKAGEESIP
ncbi:hypothetical protein SAMN02746041_01082 [Desulfacinum hydrothermale DSM 13146]|uniref:SSD domain-containing protein n=1 Tax=Desulfacinum hydrothermale DSM 13146 TaxID=1121390 RepID=A0A1W1XAV9_9BACT|nr:MMPL family transporter [Desulfacinum hydrothermale]SMC20999.1 hypothetical protein SAMN02746041_01082 [Desulfacinum hydrothermale DSM 13146]